MSLPVVTLKINRNSPHPWIFSKMVEIPRDRLEPGALVEVRSRNGEFACWGSYHPKQMIMIRVLGEDRASPPSGETFHRTLSVSKELREDILRLGEVTDSYRLAHSEADGLCGFIIDKLGKVVAVEAFSAAINTAGPWIVSALKHLYPECTIAVLPAAKIERVENVSCAAICRAFPPPERSEVTEHGLRFTVNFATGHKTGFFLDQRDNRLAVRRLAQGRTVLDLCCYSGGFALNAVRGRASKVTGVDLDEKAIAQCRENAQLNSMPVDGKSLDFVHADVFDFLRDVVTNRRQSDLVILDPSKFVPRRDDMARGLTKYRDINKLGIQAVKPGGVLVTCSCSGLVDRQTFYETVRQSALDAGRTLQFLGYSGASADHPVSSVFPEGEYLKALFARVL